MNCGKVPAPALVATNIGAALLHVTSCCVAKLECRNELVHIFYGKKMLALGLCPKLNVTNLSLLLMAKNVGTGSLPKVQREQFAPTVYCKEGLSLASLFYGKNVRSML